MNYHAVWKKARFPLDLIAFLLAVLNRRKPFYLFQVYWSFCSHRGHKNGARCWRWFVYDSYCHQHLATCMYRCKPHAS